MSQWIQFEDSELELTANDAYDAMITAYNAGQWWAAASLAAGLKKWLETSPGEARYFARRKWMNVLAVESGAKKHLEKSEDTDDNGTGNANERLAARNDA